MGSGGCEEGVKRMCGGVRRSVGVVQGEVGVMGGVRRG